ncbi:hypothetical protein UUU_26060 (plasmid) [Klebsiella pneumoniae subsp. pneumoniae DSM 30104 = JCM 1662 = NBRC 14940]|nr:hypothetical protein UUU_26060 [Klebsiella pneumoniae subsp. pneumoniae DSM 30104 = JCM 1662 = NBRC 14940]
MSIIFWTRITASISTWRVTVALATPPIPPLTNQEEHSGAKLM